MKEDGKKVLELTVSVGEILLKNGAEIFRVQETMERIARAYRTENFHVYVISNGLFASVDEDGRVHSTEVRHVPLSAPHLGRVAALNQLSREIEAGICPLEEAFARLEEVKHLPYSPPALQALACAVGSACFSFLFGGGLLDSAAALVSGFVLQLFLFAAGRYRLSKMVTNILASALVTLCGFLLLQAGLGRQMDKIIIGSIIPLVPGMALTTSIRDFFNGDYVSGAIRLIDALLIGACIALGVGAVLKMCSLLGFSVGVA